MDITPYIGTIITVVIAVGGVYIAENNVNVYPIDASDLASVRLALTLQGKNFELIDTKRTRQSTIFGTVMADMMGSVTGTLSNMTVRGKLDILDKTDMTYILKDSPLTVDNRLDDKIDKLKMKDGEQHA